MLKSHLKDPSTILVACEGNLPLTLVMVNQLEVFQNYHAVKSTTIASHIMQKQHSFLKKQNRICVFQRSGANWASKCVHLCHAICVCVPVSVCVHVLSWHVFIIFENLFKAAMPAVLDEKQEANALFKCFKCLLFKCHLTSFESSSVLPLSSTKTVEKVLVEGSKWKGCIFGTTLRVTACQLAILFIILLSLIPEHKYNF